MRKSMVRKDSRRRKFVFLSLVDGDVIQAGGAGVLSERPDEFVVGILFQHVGRPAGDPADGKNQRVKIDWNTQHVIGRRRIEIDIGVDALFAHHHLSVQQCSEEGKGR